MDWGLGIGIEWVCAVWSLGFRELRCRGPRSFFVESVCCKDPIAAFSLLFAYLVTFPGRNLDMF